MTNVVGIEETENEYLNLEEKKNFFLRKADTKLKFEYSTAAQTVLKSLLTLAGSN